MAILGLVVEIVNATSAWKSKSILEQRIEVLERARKDQQDKNDAQDVLNSIKVNKLLEGSGLTDRKVQDGRSHNPTSNPR